jgi:hypothetical protein
MAALYWKVRKDDGTWRWVPAIYDFNQGIHGEGDAQGSVEIGANVNLWYEGCTCARCTLRYIKSQEE